MHIQVCLCERVCTCVYTYVYANSHLYTCTHVHTHTCIHICTQFTMHIWWTCICYHRHLCMRISFGACTHVFTFNCYVNMQRNELHSSNYMITEADKPQCSAITEKVNQGDGQHMLKLNTHNAIVTNPACVPPSIDTQTYAPSHCRTIKPPRVINTRSEVKGRVILTFVISCSP